ncbi:MAG: hypothetical protein ACREIF_03845 [Chthoniobacterales bacterium]
MRYLLFAPYAVELVCNDLRSDAKHTITLELARDTRPGQDAVDRELARRCRPGKGREALAQLVKRVGIVAHSRHDFPLVSLSAVTNWSRFHSIICRLADAPWQSLWYRLFSAYITPLVGYGLLAGGAH